MGVIELEQSIEPLDEPIGDHFGKREKGVVSDDVGNEDEEIVVVVQKNKGSSPFKVERREEKDDEKQIVVDPGSE